MKRYVEQWVTADGVEEGDWVILPGYAPKRIVSVECEELASGEPMVRLGWQSYLTGQNEPFTWVIWRADHPIQVLVLAA